MQTFLPYSNFARSASCLDMKRLGKQRLECHQIIIALTVPGAGWKNHPATLMWSGHIGALVHYMSAVVDEWVKRGYKNNLVVPFMLAHPGWCIPSWIGNEEFHRSHRSNLLRKDPVHYGQFGWTEPSDLPYIWPSKENTMQTIKFDAMTIEQLQVAHSEMCATAGDLGVSLPSNLTVDFDTVGAGAIVCDEVDDLIKKHQAGVEDGKKPSTTEGQKVLAPGDESEQGAKVPKKRASKPKPVASTKPKEPAKPKEAPVAKKAAKKTAKKAPAKAPKKAASGEARVARSTHDEAAKVTWIGGDNPCRAGTGRHTRYELLRKGSGQTVKTLMGKGVPSATLTNASKAKLIKIG